MGFRFGIAQANLVANLLEETGPPIEQLRDAGLGEALAAFAHQLEHRFMSGPESEARFSGAARRLKGAMDERAWSQASQAFEEVRYFLSGRPWTAMLLPSGRDHEMAEYLCSPELLRDLVSIRPEDPGLILQLDTLPSEGVALLNAFPAFRIAATRPSSWPAVLLTGARGATVALPLPRDGRENVRVALRWLFATLAEHGLGALDQVALDELCREYGGRYAAPLRSRGLTLIHVSDTHVGVKVANQKLPALSAMIRRLTEEAPPEDRKVVVITGDLVNNRGRRDVNAALMLLDSIRGACGEDAVVVAGNHDVRRFGLFAASHREFLEFSSPRVHWLDDVQVGLICLNSVKYGRMARGTVGADQLNYLGAQLDRERGRREYSLFALLHHHVTEIPTPEWYAQPFYEAWMGSAFEHTMALVDAQDVRAFLASRGVLAALHGHKHIPHITSLGPREPLVVGCGSSVGNVRTVDGRPYLSLNVVQHAPNTGRTLVTLFAQRTEGGDLEEEGCHCLLSGQ